MSPGARDYLRWHVANAASWPFWKAHGLGLRALRMHDRIIRWGEMARGVRGE